MSKDRTPARRRLDDLPDALTPGDVAAVLQTTTRNIYRQLAAQRFPKPVKIGRLTRWSKEQIRALLPA